MMSPTTTYSYIFTPQIKKHKKKSNERKKRQELSKSATRGLNNTNISELVEKKSYYSNGNNAYAMQLLL